MNKMTVAKTVTVIYMAIIAFIVVYKAFKIPVTYDESNNWMQFASNTNIPAVIFFGGDKAINHILNTVAIEVCVFFFGAKPWVMRLPNVLSFFLFGFCLYLLAQKYFSKSPFLFCLPFMFMFCNPYLVDYYSMARGYGMGNALMACSVFCLLLYSSSNTTAESPIRRAGKGDSAGNEMRLYYGAIVFAMLAAYANFTFLIYWAAVHILLVGMMLVRRPERRSAIKTLVITTCIALGFMALCYIPLAGQQNSIKGFFGPPNSFYDDTISSAINKYEYGRPFPFLPNDGLAVIAIAVIFVSFVVCFQQIKNLSSVFTEPFSLVFILLILTCIVNIIQVYLFNTAYLADRTALIYYVLFIFVLVFLFRDLIQRRVFGSVVVTGLVLLLVTVKFFLAVNLKSVFSNSFDAYTYDVLNYMDDYRHKHPEAKNIEMECDNSLWFSFWFPVSTGKLPWLKLIDAEDNVDTASKALFYYTRITGAEKLKDFTPVKKFMPTGMYPTPSEPRSGLVLMIHK